MSAEHNAPRRTIRSAESIAHMVEQRRAGDRKCVLHGKTLCSRCLINPPRPGQRYCRMCKNADDRERRSRNKAAMADVAARLKVE